MNHKYWEPFQIEEKIINNTYKLRLPNFMKIHSIFNTDRLKSYYENVFTEQETYLEIIKEIEKWEIEKIQKKKEDKFLIKWKGFVKSTWEPRQNLIHYDETIKK